MHGRHLDAVIGQDLRAVAATGSPERVDHHLDPGVRDDLEVNQLGQPLKVDRLDINLFILGRAGGRDGIFVAERRNMRLQLPGGFRQRRGAVRSRELDAVVLRRIVRGGEVDGAAGLVMRNGVGDGGSRRGLGDHDRRDAVGLEHARSFQNKSLAQEAWIAPDQNGVGARLLSDELRDTGDSPADVRHGELVGDDRAPAGSSELDLGRHCGCCPLFLGCAKSQTYYPRRQKLCVAIRTSGALLC